MSQAEQQPQAEDKDLKNVDAEQNAENGENVEKKEEGPNVMDKTMDTFRNLCDWNIFWWEFFGTALFAHGIGCSDGQDWYITISLFAAILIIAPFTGGHVNPAVSFGFLIKNAIIPNEKSGLVSWEWKDFFTRASAQFIGAMTGGLTAFAIVGASSSPQIPSEDWRMLGGYFVGEAFGTMTFVITILIMTDNRTKLIDEPHKDLNGNVVQKPVGWNSDLLAVVATISLALHYSRCFTFKTGGGLNPSIAIGTQIWDAINNLTFEPLIHSWLFLTGPFLGAAVAAYYFSYFHFNATNGTGWFAPPQPKAAEEKKSEEEPAKQEGGKKEKETKK